MTVQPCEGTCSAIVCRESPGVATFDHCGRPAVVLLTTWARRTECLCPDHAREVARAILALAGPDPTEARP